MALQSLLLSRDDDVIRILRRVLSDMEIELEVCTGSERATEELARHKYDAVIIDCDDVHGAADVLRNLRKMPSNKTSTAFAIIHGVTSVRGAFEMGANLALEKPITADRAKHSFRAAHGLMLQERRRYHRHPVDMSVTLRVEHKGVRQEFSATAHDLSEGGMAMKVKGALPGEIGNATVKFALPGTHTWVETHVGVAWADGEGHAGVRFENIPYTTKENLEKWFTANTEAGAKPGQPPKPAKRRFFS